MGLLWKAAIILVLLAMPIVPIFANNMGGQDNGGSTSSETGSTIIIKTSGGYSGSYSGGYSSGYSSGYYTGQKGGVTVGSGSPYKTPFLGVLLTNVQSDSDRLGNVGTELEALKQAEKVGGEKWNKLDKLETEVNDIQKDLQQNINTMNGNSPATWDANPSPDF